MASELRSALRSPLVWAGLSLWAASLVVWVAVWFLAPRTAAAMGGTFLAFFFGGKLAAVPTGLSLGLNPLWIIAIVAVPDAGAVLVTYPLLRTGWKYAGRWSFALAELRKRAENPHARHRRLIQRYGAWGVLLLTITPIGFVSALVVAAIGQLMGLSPRRVVVPVIVGQFVMGAVLVFLFRLGLGAAARLHPLLPFVVTGALVAFLVSREVYLRIQQRKKGPHTDHASRAKHA